MKRAIIVVVAVVAIAAFVHQQADAQRGEAPGQGAQAREIPRSGGPATINFTPPPGAVELQYDAVGNLLKLPPDVGTLGEVVGVARDSKANIYIYTRAAHQRLFEFDRNGKYMREIGKDMYAADFAHVVRVDKDDNIWAVDEGSNMIVKFNQAGEVVMTLGRKWEIPDGRPEEPTPGGPRPIPRGANFNRQTDVAWDPQGNIYVADGYNNSRVVKFAKDGDLVKWVGTRGTGPLEFNTPHSIAADSKGNIYVADRGNNRIQVLDTDLNFKAEWKGFGAPWAICVTPAPNEYLFTADPNGHIYKVDMNGKILAWMGKSGHDVGEFQWIHELHCTSETELLVGEIQNWRMTKLTIKGPKSSPATR